MGFNISGRYFLNFKVLGGLAGRVELIHYRQWSSEGRASDVVVGQIQRYMGYVLGELAEEGQSVKGVIIALEDDLRIRRALQVANNIDFYRYEVSFKLNKEQV